MLEIDSVTSTLDLFVQDLLTELCIDSFPLCPFLIAKSLGLQIQRNCKQSERGRLSKRSGRGVIVLGAEVRRERDCWTVAHEIGEFLFPKIQTILPLDDSDTLDRECLANRFAERLLVPTAWLRDAIDELGLHLFGLKRRFETASHEIISLRCLDFREAMIVTVIDNGRVTRRRSNLPHSTPAMTPLEWSVQRESHTSGEVNCLKEDIVEATAWPLHEPVVQREIILTTIDIDAGW